MHSLSPLFGIRPISIDGLFASDGFSPNPMLDVRGLLTRCELILGVDVMSGREFIVHGREALKEVIRTGRSREMMTLRVELDADTGELGRLLAVLQVVKGRHDDEQADGPGDPPGT